MVHIITTEKEVNDLIATSKYLLVVDVFATWCSPCKALSPKLDMMEAEYPNVTFVKVDADKLSGFADENGVSDLPTVMFFKYGKEVERVAGLKEASIRDAITKHM